jgi:hypothetical protein
MDEQEQAVALQIESSQFSCKLADDIIRKWKRARTNKERAKFIPKLEAMKGRMMLELRFIDKTIEENLDDEEEDRGF